MSISVLYVHATGAFGGASRSLLEMIKAFPKDSVSPHVITAKGKFLSILQKEHVPVIETIGITQFDNTRYGYYRGFRWLILVREIFLCLHTLRAFWRAKSVWKCIDVVHLNEITLLLPIVFSKLIFRKPVVVHVRSVQKLGLRLRTQLVAYVLRKFADVIVCIDETVRRSLPKGIKATTIHNGFSAPDTKSNEGIKTFFERLPKKHIRVAMVGNFLPMKGGLDFVDAARLCIEKKMKIDFIMVGDNPRTVVGMKGFLLKQFNFVHDMKSEIQKRIKLYGIENSLHLLPFTFNIKEIYENIQLICFPSHLDAVGRPVLEAAFFKIPSIVSVTNPLEDTIVDNETGICIEAKNAHALAEAIEYFYLNPDEINRMGNAAYLLALKNFDIEKNSITILNLYLSLLEGERLV